MLTLILKFAYDGTNYCGWQRQLNAMTVQEKVEEAVFKLFGSKISVVAAGRTDTGVHARGMIAHAKLEKNHVPEEKLAAALNSYLPEDIHIINAAAAEAPFHSRFDAIARRYSYTIGLNRDVLMRNYSWQLKFPIEREKLNLAAPLFLGVHDFTTFSKFNPSTESYICNVEICEWKEEKPGIFVLTIKADRFVYGMVRALTGAMVDFARNKRSYDELEKALTAKDRNLSSPLAPPHGLIFEQAYYNKEVQSLINFL